MSEWKNQDFSQLTVLELRKVAKAMGVQLGAGISKAGIVEKLDRARNAKYSDIPAVPMDFTPIPKSDDKQESPVEKAEVPAAVKDEKPSESPAPANKQPVPAADKPETAAPAVAAPAVAAPKPEAEKPAAPAQPASDARPAISGFRPARPVNYTRFGPAAQADSTNDRSYDAPRTTSSWADRRPAYGSDVPDRRPAYGTDAPDRRPAYGSDLPDRRPAYGTDAPRSAFGTDAPRYSRSYDVPSAFDSGRARQPAFNSPQRDVPSDLQSMWAGSPSDMLSPAECQDGSGILELHPDGYGFLRGASLTPSNRDIYISMAQVRRFYLRTGDFVTGKVRPQRDGDKYSAMLYITEVNGCPADSLASRPAFDALTPCYPHEHIPLEVEGGSSEFLDMRLIDLVAPIGFGQRGLIHCPPAVDKAHLLSSIANAASICHPDAVVMTLLLGGTPEDATLYRDHTHGEVIASTFDQTPENHLRITNMVLERAERLVEMKKNVILLVDSLTYLSKVYTTAAVQQGRQTIGMVNPVSLQKAKKLFGAARCLREGGSLTIFAVMNIETGSRVDDSIAEDLKGTANMELVLDTAAARAGIYPPVNLLLSGTKRAELIASKEQLDGIKLIHEMLGSLRAVDMIPQLLSMLEKTTNNEDLLVRIKDWAALMKQ